MKHTANVSGRRTKMSLFQTHSSNELWALTPLQLTLLCLHVPSQTPILVGNVTLGGVPSAVSGADLGATARTAR